MKYSIITYWETDKRDLQYMCRGEIEFFFFQGLTKNDCVNWKNLKNIVNICVTRAKPMNGFRNQSSWFENGIVSFKFELKRVIKKNKKPRSPHVEEKFNTPQRYACI